MNEDNEIEIVYSNTCSHEELMYLQGKYNQIRSENLNKLYKKYLKGDKDDRAT
jgi:hypothetical protein